MKQIRKILIAACAVVMIALGGAVAPATASPWQNGVVESNEAAYYYLSNLSGAFWDTDTAVSALTYGPGFFLYYRYVSAGAGSGDVVKDNAESLWNRRSQGCRSYYSSGFAGQSDYIQPNSWANLVFTYNDNASFKWI